MSGKIYLVGAGPGDPDLLTLKAARALRTADVVLHDDLVSPDILALIPSTARVQNVGKRCGEKKITQEEINGLMAAYAGSGLQVVRLKCGDPFIFGRVGEEIAALRRAEIAFELIPGVTAAVGAAASVQIPLTDRNLSSSVVFIPGHHAVGQATDWAALASLNATLVIYMPGSRYEELAVNLSSAGFGTQTACAIVSRASTPEEEIFVTNLAELAAAPRLPSPTLLIVGDVVQLANPLVANASASWNCCLPDESALPQSDSQ